MKHSSFVPAQDHYNPILVNTFHNH